MQRRQRFATGGFAPALGAFGRGPLSALGAALAALLADLDIIRAITLRNLRIKYQHNALGIFAELLRPVVVCVAHYYYFSLSQRNVPGHQYIIFTVGGFTIWFTFAAAYHGTMEGTQWPGGVTALPGVTLMHLRVSRVLWAYVLHVFLAFALVPILAVFGQNISMPLVILTLTTYGLAVGLGFGYGLICAAIAHAVPALAPFIKIFEWIVFITSGVYDSLVTMPYIMAQIVQYNPIIDLAEFQRYAYYQGYPTYLVTLTYPVIWMLALIFVGLAMNRAMSRNR